MPLLPALWCAMSTSNTRSSVRRMFREIDAEVYLMVDGDDTYPAEAAPEMVRKVREEQADMVVGDRLSSTYYTEKQAALPQFWEFFREKLH